MNREPKPIDSPGDLPAGLSDEERMAFLENHFETEGSEDAATAGTYDVMRETERIVEESLLRSRTDEPTEGCERRMTGQRCNSCGHRFEDFAWHEAIQASDQGMIGWNIASGNAFAGVSCPNCGSKLIRARHR